MKPGVFTQMYIHIIFAPKYRERLLKEEIRSEVFSYISGIITNKGHKSIIVNGVIDHVHILFGLNPKESISDIVGSIKRDSSTFINDKKMFNGKFHWQDGYGAFTYSRSQLNAVYKYILNQEVHHKKRTFREEYMELLSKFEVPYDKRFLFDFFEDVEIE